MRYAEDGEGDAAEPIGEPCDKASANDARSGGGDGVRARATALTDDLAENFEDPEAIQLTTYQPRGRSLARRPNHHASTGRRPTTRAHLHRRAGPAWRSTSTRGRASSRSRRCRCARAGQARPDPRCEPRPEGRHAALGDPLLPRSIYLMSGPARANCHLKDEPNVQAQGNHKGCPCCWTHGIDTDQTEAQGRIGVTFRQLAPWALHEAELKRLADERAERDKAAEEGALQPRRRSTPATKRDAPAGPATWLSGEGADAGARVALDAGARRRRGRARGRGRADAQQRARARLAPRGERSGARGRAAAARAEAARRVDGVGLGRRLLGPAGARREGEGRPRGSPRRAGEPRQQPRGERKWEGKALQHDVSMPQEFPCYYDIVGKELLRRPTGPYEFKTRARGVFRRLPLPSASRQRLPDHGRSRRGRRRSRAPRRQKGDEGPDLLPPPGPVQGIGCPTVREAPSSATWTRTRRALRVRRRSTPFRSRPTSRATSRARRRATTRD